MIAKSRNTLQICCVTIGHQEFLLPVSVGMKVVELMQQAIECRHSYEENGYHYYSGEQPQVEFKLVNPSKLHISGGEDGLRISPALRRLRG